MFFGLLPSLRDALARLPVNEELRVKGQKNIYAAGDVAFMRDADDSHYPALSFQSACDVGAVAGHNAAAELTNSAPKSFAH